MLCYVVMIGVCVCCMYIHLASVHLNMVAVSNQWFLVHGGVTLTFTELKNLCFTA